MKNKQKNEFIDFLKGTHQRAENTSEYLNKENLGDLFSLVQKDLHPNAYGVFLKIIMTHIFASLITLSVCPQFGVRLFGEGMGLMSYFMHFGEMGCLVFCGMFYMGVSFLCSHFILNFDECRVVRKNRFLQMGGVILLTIGFFIMIEGEVIYSTLSAWVIGTVIGSFIGFELPEKIRKIAIN